MKKTPLVHTHQGWTLWQSFENIRCDFWTGTHFTLQIVWIICHLLWGSFKNPARTCSFLNALFTSLLTGENGNYFPVCNVGMTFLSISIFHRCWSPVACSSATGLFSVLRRTAISKTASFINNTQLMSSHRGPCLCLAFIGSLSSLQIIHNFMHH